MKYNKLQETHKQLKETHEDLEKKITKIRIHKNKDKFKIYVPEIYDEEKGTLRPFLTNIKAYYHFY